MKPLSLFVILLFGCAGNQALEASVTATNTASRVLQVLDQQIEPLYEAAATAALDGLPTGASYQDYQEAMARWDAVETGLGRAHIALLGAQDALKAWDSGSQSAAGDYRAKLACVVEGLRAVADAAPGLEISLPPELTPFLDTAKALAGACDGS